MITFNSLLDNFHLQHQITLQSWLKNVIREEKKRVGDIVYVFTRDEYLYSINKDFLQHKTYTDIITFDTSESGDVLSGEIYISIDRVKENAKIQRQAFRDELARVLVHGILHLVGYNDKTDSEKAEMTSKEDYYVNLLSQF